MIAFEVKADVGQLIDFMPNALAEIGLRGLFFFCPLAECGLAEGRKAADGDLPIMLKGQLFGFETKNFPKDLPCPLRMRQPASARSLIAGPHANLALDGLRRCFLALGLEALRNLRIGGHIAGSHIPAAPVCCS